MLHSRSRTAVALVLLLTPAVWGGDISIDGKKRVPAGGYAELSVKTQPGDVVSWQILPSPPQKTVRGELLIFALTQGQRYSVGVTVVNFKAERLDQGSDTIEFDGNPAPDPTPPGPNPPPGPTPQPDTSPFPTAGLRVLFVEETADRGKLPPAQLNAMFAKQVTDYLNAKCPAGPDGKTKEWRRWDKDWSAAGEPKMWQDVFARPRTSLPWVVVGNGTTGYEGPVPADTPALLALLKKYGGE